MILSNSERSLKAVWTLLKNRSALKSFSESFNINLNPSQHRNLNRKSLNRFKPEQIISMINIFRSSSARWLYMRKGKRKSNISRHSEVRAYGIQSTQLKTQFQRRWRKYGKLKGERKNSISITTQQIRSLTLNQSHDFIFRLTHPRHTFNFSRWSANINSCKVSHEFHFLHRRDLIFPRQQSSLHRQQKLCLVHGTPTSLSPWNYRKMRQLINPL